MPNDIPDAPWELSGEAVALLASPFAARLLVKYEHSPVGPYDEHALATLTRRGPHVFQMSVNLDASRRGGREIWGFPKTLESLNWSSYGSHIRFQREEQRFRVRVTGPQWNFALPFWTAQQKEGVWLCVPGHIKARAQLGFRGPQLALVLRSFEMRIEPPRSFSE